MTNFLKIIPLAVVIFLSWAGICFGENLTVTVMDVGQADSILIQTAGKTVLIDAGEEKDLVKEKLAQKHISNIDLVVATHPHADHIGGMLAVLENVNIKVYMDNGFPHTTQMYRAIMEVAEGKVAAGSMKYMPAQQGQRLNLGKEAHFEIILPTETGLSGTRSDINANSIIMKLVHGDVCFWFMGDAEAETEQAALPFLEKCQILKVAHHGSPHSSTPAFLDKVMPEVALISAGLANKHGHPGKSTIEALTARHAAVYRTDWMGEVTVVSDGKNYTVSTEKNLTLADLPCIDVNRGTAEEFGALNGIGKTTIDKVMETRSQHMGIYDTVEAFLADLPPEPAKRLGKISEYLSVNCAARGKETLPQPQPNTQIAVQTNVVMPSSGVQPAGSVVNINIASEAQLAAMPGMSAKKAAAAIEYRTNNGAFTTCRDLVKVNGIGAKTVDKLLSVCTTDSTYAAPQGIAVQQVAVAQPAAGSGSGCVNINIASESEMAALPGMSAKKASAAVEYRNTVGTFATCNDLVKVNGIGPKTVEKLLSSCCVK